MNTLLIIFTLLLLTAFTVTLLGKNPYYGELARDTKFSTGVEVQEPLVKATEVDNESTSPTNRNGIPISNKILTNEQLASSGEHILSQDQEEGITTVPPLVPLTELANINEDLRFSTLSLPIGKVLIIGELEFIKYFNRRVANSRKKRQEVTPEVLLKELHKDVISDFKFNAGAKLILISRVDEIHDIESKGKEDELCLNVMDLSIRKFNTIDALGFVVTVTEIYEDPNGERRVTDNTFFKELPNYETVGLMNSLEKSKWELKAV